MVPTRVPFPVVPWCVLALLSTVPAGAEPRQLRGQVLVVGAQDETQPAAGAQVVLQGFGNPTRTGSDGVFRLFLPEALLPGDSIHLQVSLKGYRLWAPMDGRSLVPSDFQRQVVEVRLLPAGSRRFLSDEGIESLLRESSERAKEQVNPGGVPQEAQVGRYVAEWARRNGLGAQQVKQEVDRWVAEVERTRGDERKLALAAFARGDYAVAAEHAESAAERKLRQLEELEQERRRLRLEAVRDLTLRGDAHFSGYAFDKALESYKQKIGRAHV